MAVLAPSCAQVPSSFGLVQRLCDARLHATLPQSRALRFDAERNADILKRLPAARWAKAEDMVGTAAYLASRASDYVHGTVLPVDGGWLAR